MNRVTSGYRPWALDKRGLAFVEQDSSNTAIIGIAWIHGYCGQAGAQSERTVSDGGDTVGDRHTGQRAGLERSVSEVGDTVGDRDAGQAGGFERVVSDAGNAVGDRDTGQAGVGEDRIHTIPNDGDRQAVDVGWNGHHVVETGVTGDGA